MHKMVSALLRSKYNNHRLLYIFTDFSELDDE